MTCLPARPVYSTSVRTTETEHARVCASVRLIVAERKHSRKILPCLLPCLTISVGTMQVAGRRPSCLYRRYDQVSPYLVRTVISLLGVHDSTVSRSATQKRRRSNIRKRKDSRFLHTCFLLGQRRPSNIKQQSKALLSNFAALDDDSLTKDSDCARRPKLQIQ
jgi:hypothetical protein